MPEDEQHGNSSEEEEEEDEPVPVRQQQVRMVVTDTSAGYGQELADSSVAKTASQGVVTTTSTTTKVADDPDLAEAQEAAIQEARKRHQEAIEKARAEAIKMQEEARARAEAARQQQQQQFQEQQKLAIEEQRQQQIKAQQEAAKLQAEQRAAQLKAQQEAQKVDASQKQQQVQQQQSKPAPPPPQQQKALTPQKLTPPTPTTPIVQKQAAQTPAQPKPAPVQSKAAVPTPPRATAPTRTPNPPKTAALIQSKSVPFSPNKSINNPSTPISRQLPPLAKEPEPLQPPKQILAHTPFQPKNPKAENHSWPPPQEDEEQIVESGKRNKILDDNSWQVQKRIQLEYQSIQPTKIQPPELDYEGEIKRTIVPQPTGYSKVQWNEFPEEEQKEKQSVPKVKAQDWIPENDAEHPILKTNYLSQAAGGNVKNVQWPPPEDKLEHGKFGTGKLNVQWPPSEQEQQEQKQIEILQTHLPTKPHQREWPPAHYIAAQGGGVEAQ